MTPSDFDVLLSEKSGINSKDSLIVVRGKTSYLRILGQAPEWELMTATASEDQGGIQVFPIREFLIEAALRVRRDRGEKLSISDLSADWMSRPYVKICTLKASPKMADEAKDIIDKFFFHFDDITTSVVIDDQLSNIIKEGGDVYLMTVLN